MADIKGLISDPEFIGLSTPEKKQILSEFDPEFGGLSDQEIQSFLGEIKSTTTLSPDRQASISQGRAEEEAITQALTQKEQRPGLVQALEALFTPVAAGADIAKGLYQTGKEGYSGLIDLIAGKGELKSPGEEIARQRRDFAQTGLEIVPRAVYEGGQGIVGLAQQPDTALALTNPVAAALTQLIQGSRTPSQSEIESAISAAQTSQAMEEVGQQPISENLVKIGEANVPVARAAPLALGAQSLVADAAKGIGKGVQSLRNIGKPNLTKIPRDIRSALKATKGIDGAKIEQAATNEIDDIFRANPNADKAAPTPLEGFGSQVKTQLSEVGNEISALRAQSVTPMTAGDQLADAIVARANTLRKAGQPKSVVDELLEIAKDKRGQMTDLNSLQEAVTLANRKWKPDRAPKSTAQEFADEIVSKEGGSIINKELESIGGPEAAALRKKWSNLKTLNDNIEARVNKLINNAPADARGPLLDALASPEGAVSVLALMNGWASGGITLASKVAQNWLKSEARALKDSNKIISRTYETLRKASPELSAARPPALPVQPPPIPTQESLNLQIQRLLEDAGVGQATPHP